MKQKELDVLLKIIELTQKDRLIWCLDKDIPKTYNSKFDDWTYLHFSLEHGVYYLNVTNQKGILIYAFKNNQDLFDDLYNAILFKEEPLIEELFNIILEVK